MKDMEMLISKTWYIEPPYDFEYKQYILLDYLQKVDKSFIQKILSPHLLFMNVIIQDLFIYKNSYIKMKKRFDKERYIFFDDNSKLIGEDNESIDVVNEIIDFSIPQIKSRIELGNNILKRHRQILY